MKYLSVCSGIEAASVAWGPLGWEPVAFSEIEKFPSAVLAHHWPWVPNLGDMTRWREWPEDLLAQADILVGGTPCVAFSVAGLRKSLDDERGQLTLTYIHLYDHIDKLRSDRGLPPAICVWENVPGVLNTKDNAFGCFLAGLAGESVPLEPPGGRWSNAGGVSGPKRNLAWRIQDAQWHGLAQRRRRVFVVAGSGDFDPSEVLLEWESGSRHIAPSREAGQVAPTIPSRSTAGGGLGTDFDCDGGLCGVSPTTAFYPTNRQPEFGNYEEVSPAVKVGSGGTSGNPPAVTTRSLVRRLTCTEVERLQGFPDGHTNIPYGRPKWPGEKCPDGVRYKSLGNSMAVPCMAWLGRRIANERIMGGYEI